MNAPTNPCQPLLETCVERDPGQPYLHLPGATFAVGVPQSLCDWRNFETPGDGRAVVTAAWLKDVAVVAVLLSGCGARVALVLDPSEPDLALAVDQWRAEGALNLDVQGGGVSQVFGLPAHVDGVVDSRLTAGGLRQGTGAFALALEDFTGVERVLDSLADSHRVPWAASRVAIQPL